MPIRSSTPTSKSASIIESTPTSVTSWLAREMRAASTGDISTKTAIEIIKRVQRHRDEENLASSRLTLREEDHFRKAVHPLADVLEWARAQTQPPSLADMKQWRARVSARAFQLSNPTWCPRVECAATY